MYGLSTDFCVWTTSFFIHNVNNLLHNPDFWFRKIFAGVCKTKHVLKGAPVTICTVCMLACSITCVFLYLVTVDNLC